MTTSRQLELPCTESPTRAIERTYHDFRNAIDKAIVDARTSENLNYVESLFELRKSVAVDEYKVERLKDHV